MSLKNALEDGDIVSYADGENQLSRNPGVILADEQGHAVLNQHDEHTFEGFPSGINVLGKENVVREGLGLPRRENYRRAPVFGNISPEVKEENNRFIEKYK